MKHVFCNLYKLFQFVVEGVSVSGVSVFISGIITAGVQSCSPSAVCDSAQPVITVHYKGL